MSELKRRYAEAFLSGFIMFGYDDLGRIFRTPTNDLKESEIPLKVKIHHDATRMLMFDIILGLSVGLLIIFIQARGGISFLVSFFPLILIVSIIGAVGRFTYFFKLLNLGGRLKKQRQNHD